MRKVEERRTEEKSASLHTTKTMTIGWFLTILFFLLFFSVFSAVSLLLLYRAVRYGAITGIYLRVAKNDDGM